MEISTMQDEIANQIFTDIKDTQGRTLTGIVKRGKVANLLTEKFEFVEKVQEENTSKYKIPDNVEEQMIAQLRRFG